MKRSEMLQQLTNLLYNSPNIDVPNSSYINNEKVAVEILEFLERSGMLPPLPNWGNKQDIRDYVWEDLQD